MISFPLTMPASVPDDVEFAGESNAGFAESPFTLTRQVYAWPADRWLATLTWTIRGRADADDVESFLLSLRGMEGSFLLGDASRPNVRGSWLGQAPLVKGAGQAGLTLLVDNLTPTTTTVLKGDFFQLSSGATARLHRVMANGTANASGEITLDVFPRLRESPADNAPLTLVSPKGLFMRADNRTRWTLRDGNDLGLSVECVEDLRAL
jgi:hypothetical protein